MSRKLNFEVVRDAVNRAGLSYTKLATGVGVSKESVSNWLRGESVPRPGVAIKLGALLNLTYEQMFGERDRTLEPQIAFRLTRNRNPSEEHHERARSMAHMFEKLAAYLPFPEFVAPPQLKNPSTEREYLESLCQTLRKEMGVGSTEPIPLTGLFDFLSNKLQAVVVPVFWGHRANNAELAAHIYSPKTKTTWIPFNLDTKLWDARFWAAHEMAHAFTHSVLPQDGEEFADAFAGTLVMPTQIAAAAYESTKACRTKQARLTVAIQFAEQMHISPICVVKQIDRYAKETGAVAVNAETQDFYAAINAHAGTNQPTLAQELFSGARPSINNLLEISSSVLKTPFFETLSKCLKKEGGNTSFIQGLLDCSLADAKSLNSELA